MDSYILPAKIARAFKPLIKKEHSQKASMRYAEFIRLGCNAYQHTLGYTDSYLMICAHWEHDQTFGNANEGWYTYMTRSEFCNTFCIMGSQSVAYPMQDSTLPFMSDIMRPDRVSDFFDLAFEPKNKRPELCKSINAKYLATVAGVLDRLSNKGSLSFNMGTSATGPVIMETFNPDLKLEVHALVMPMRG